MTLRLIALDNRAYRAILLACCLFGLCAVSAEAWDGNWTQAKSGTEGALYDQGTEMGVAGTKGRIYDPGNSTGKAGTKEPPQKFWIPPNPQFADVDLKDADNYYRKDYSPYAMVLFPQNVTFGNQFLQKGYYLVQPGSADDGSANKSQRQFIAQNTDPNEITPNLPSLQSTNQELPEDMPATALIVKKLGKVVAVLPVDMTIPVPKGWWKIRKKSGKMPAESNYRNHLGAPAVEWTYNAQIPILHVYDKYWHYQVLFQPS